MNEVSASPPAPPIVVRCETEVAASADAAWAVMGDFAGAGRYLDVASSLVAGAGGIGSVRIVGDAILELMVGSSVHGYTYAQTQGPMAARLYHGCVALEAVHPSSTRIVYTLTFTSEDAGERDEAERTRIAGRFQGAVDRMRQHVEREIGR